MPPETCQHAPAEAENQMCERSGLIIPNLVVTEGKGRREEKMMKIPVREVIFQTGRARSTRAASVACKGINTVIVQTGRASGHSGENGC